VPQRQISGYVHARKIDVITQACQVTRTERATSQCKLVNLRKVNYHPPTMHICYFGPN